MHAHVRRQRLRGLDRLIGNDYQLITRLLDFDRKVLEQVLGVVTNPRSPGSQRRSIEGNPHQMSPGPT